MSSGKRWVEMGQGSFIKWETPGQQIEGRWAGKVTTGQWPNGVLDTADGRVSFPFNKSLEDLERLPIGTEVLIKYLGKKANKKGTSQYNAFQVFVAGGGDHAPDDPADDVPF